MKQAWKVVIGTLAILIVLLLIAEAGIRMFISNQISSEFADQPGAVSTAEPQVSFGSQPVTLGLLGGALPHMTLTTPSTLVVNGNEIAGNPASTVEMHNVRFNGGNPVAETLHVTTELPNDFLRATLNQQIRSQLGDNRFLNNVITVSEVTTNPQAGTFTLMFTGGAAGIELKPVTQGGQLQFEATGTQLFGMNLPDDVARAISGALADGMQQGVTGSMRVADFDVVPGGLRVEMAGSNVDFTELQQLEPAVP